MDEVLVFIDEVNKKPFFLYYSPYAVHSPIHAYKKLLSNYTDKAEWNGQNNPAYASMIENLDNQIGRLITHLKNTKLLGNTLIIFISDNGGVYRVTKQWPLRAGKGSYYEGGIREPMFIYWKDHVEPGSSSDFPVSNMDFFPTILEIIGTSVEDKTKLDGMSIVPLINGNTLSDRSLFWHFPFYLEGGNKETQDPKFRTRPGSALRYGDWKLIEYFENGDFELYNLREDIGEKNNLAGSESQKLDELKNMLKKWRQNVGAPVPVEINPDWIAK